MQRAMREKKHVATSKWKYRGISKLSPRVTKIALAALVLPVAIYTVIQITCRELTLAKGRPVTAIILSLNHERHLPMWAEFEYTSDGVRHRARTDILGFRANHIRVGQSVPAHYWEEHATLDDDLGYMQWRFAEIVVLGVGLGVWAFRKGLIRVGWLPASKAKS
jgi:hypothetical protein